MRRKAVGTKHASPPSFAFNCPVIARIPELRRISVTRERQARDAAQKKRLTVKDKRFDRRAGLERVGQGDGPLVADRVVWKERECEGKEMRRRGYEGMASWRCGFTRDGSESKKERTKESM